MKNNFGRGMVLVVAAVAVVMIMTLLTGPYFGAAKGKEEKITYNQFLQYVQEGAIDQVAIYNDYLVGLTKESDVEAKRFPKTYDFTCDIPEQTVLTGDIAARIAKQQGVDKEQISSSDWGFAVDYVQPPAESIWSFIIPNLILIGIIGLMLYLFMRQFQSNNNKAMSFGKSRAKMADDDSRKVTFADVAGADEEKEELAEIVEFLKNPKKFVDLGARIPKGVLLVGPPGTGKTWLARAVAGEAGVPFFSISGSDFVELYVGVGASRVRDLFERAKRSAPCIVFIDEIDAVGRHRGAGMGGGHDEREQTLNQLLVEMDGFSANEGIIIIAATNRPDILDPALLRPGRFDRTVTVGYPDVKGREEILKIHSRKKPLEENVDLGVVARLTPWFTPADLENIMNEAAILTARRNLTKIPMDVITEAITRVEMGPEKRSHKVIERDREIVACHESGHAIVAAALPGVDPVKEVSIIARGQAGGYTQTLAEEETRFITRSRLVDRLAMTMGGHAAEKVFFGDVSTGSTSDLKSASETARRMITEYGMSESIGPLYLAGDKEVFLGRDYGHTQNFSEELSANIDKEAKRLLSEAMDTARNIITQRKDVLKNMMTALIEREKITGDEVKKLMAGEELPPLNKDEKVIAPDQGLSGLETMA